MRHSANCIEKQPIMSTWLLAHVNKLKNGRKETLDGSLGTVGFTFLGKHDLSCTAVMNKLNKNFSIVVNRRSHWIYCAGDGQVV